jgi:alcohol dehydrogenase (cytochrome c)
LGHRQSRSDFVGDQRQTICTRIPLIAVNADTGKLKWHFQFVPHDVNDIDSTEIPVLLDTEFRGQLHKLLLFANRNGFFYIFDRVTGEFLHAKQFARQTWTKGLDARGRPIPNLETAANNTGALVYPDDDGITNWFSPSYSPQTGIFYQNVREKGGIYYRSEAVYQPGKMFLGASKREVPGEEPKGALRALDALSGDVKWDFPVHTPPWCGLVSTAGGLVFSGTMEGDFFDAQNGKLLWLQTGGEIWSNPSAICTTAASMLLSPRGAIGFWRGRRRGTRAFGFRPQALWGKRANEGQTSQFDFVQLGPDSWAGVTPTIR